MMAKELTLADLGRRVRVSQGCIDGVEIWHPLSGPLLGLSFSTRFPGSERVTVTLDIAMPGYESAVSTMSNVSAASISVSADRAIEFLDD